MTDDRLTAFDLQCQLTDLGHTVLRPVASAAVALAMVRVFQPEAVFLDRHLPGDLDGRTVGGLIEAASIPVIYLSDAPRAQLTADHQGTAPRFSLATPLADAALVRTLERALQYGARQRHLHALQSGVVEHRVQATVLEARGKACVQQVQGRRERIEGQDPTPEELPTP